MHKDILFGVAIGDALGVPVAIGPYLVVGGIVFGKGIICGDGAIIVQTQNFSVEGFKVLCEVWDIGVTGSDV